MTRKLLPCLLAVAIVALVGCNKQGGGPAGTGPGVVAADDPLTFVPSDTPYVFANIDPVPTDVMNAWLDRVDKNGKVGDTYANEIDTFEKMARDQTASCGPAASGGGGSAMQDPPAAPGGSDSPAGDSGGNAGSPPADAGAPPSDAPTGNVAAPEASDTAAFVGEDKCSPAAIAERDKGLKVMEAVKAEVAGKDVKGLMDTFGLSPQVHAAFFGIGLVPVLRVELAKPDNLRATIGRLETAYGSKIPTGKVGSLDYWIVATGKPEDKVEGVFAISGKQLVATLAPVNPSDADLKTLFGIDKPGKSLADSGDLAAFDKKMNYLSYGSGYFDSSKLVAELKAPATPLETSFLTATGGKKPAIDAVCSGEYDQLAAAWPRISFGYSELSAQHMALRGVLEARADIAKDLMSLRAPMPGLGASQDALVDFGFSANLGKLPDLANKYADAVAKTPWKCPALVQLNQSAEQSKTALTNPGFAGYSGMFHGIHAIVDKLDLKDDQPMPDVGAVIAIGSDNPAGLLGMAGSMVPGIATMGLKPDGVAKPLPPMPNLQINAPMFAAMTDKVLGLSIGTGEDAKLAGAMKTDDAQQPLFEAGGKGDIYKVIAQIERKGEKNMTDPAAQKSMEQQAQMMDMYAGFISRFDVRVELTDQGIELHESVDTK